MGAGNKYTQEIITTLDLHGYRIKSALDEVEELMAKNKINRGKHLKIITGKGLHSAESGSSIRESVKAWLTSQGYNYRYAKQHDGGEGALIVNL